MRRDIEHADYMQITTERLAGMSYVALMPNVGKITLLQLDGILKPEEFKTCMQTALIGCRRVYEVQRKALMEKYFQSGEQ